VSNTRKVTYIRAMIGLIEGGVMVGHAWRKRYLQKKTNTSLDMGWG